jgi:hypothetical protein
MEIVLESDSPNYVYKCRFCLEFLDFDQEIYLVSEFTRRLYRTLINEDLEYSDLLSKNCCKNCHDELKHCSAFKQKILDNQKEQQEYLARIQAKDDATETESTIEDLVEESYQICDGEICEMQEIEEVPEMID